MRAGKRLAGCPGRSGGPDRHSAARPGGPAPRLRQMGLASYQIVSRRNQSGGDGGGSLPAPWKVFGPEACIFYWLLMGARPPPLHWIRALLAMQHRVTLVSTFACAQPARGGGVPCPAGCLSGLGWQQAGQRAGSVRAAARAASAPAVRASARSSSRALLVRPAQSPAVCRQLRKIIDSMSARTWCIACASPLRACWPPRPPPGAAGGLRLGQRPHPARPPAPPGCATGRSAPCAAPTACWQMPPRDMRLAQPVGLRGPPPHAGAAGLRRAGPDGDAPAFAAGATIPGRNPAGRGAPGGQPARASARTRAQRCLLPGHSPGAAARPQARFVCSAMAGQAGGHRLGGTPV